MFHREAGKLWLAFPQAGSRLRKESKLPGQARGVDEIMFRPGERINFG